MRKFLVLILLLILGLGIFLLLQRREKSAATATSAGTPASQASPAEARTNAMGLTPPALSPPSVTSNAANPIPSSTLNPPSSPAGSAPSETSAALPILPPLTVLDNCRVVIHNYHGRFGENPVGDNAEITAALRGQNPRQVNFLRDDLGLRLNEKGEMLDGYGTPFFFHQLSADRMEIRSAGLDRILFTFDDVVTR